VPMKSGQEKKVWFTAPGRNRIALTGDIETATISGTSSVTVKESLDEADSFGFIIETDQSGSAGSDEIEEYFANLHSRAHVERLWCFGNTIRLLVYPNIANWGTFTFTPGSVTVTVNGVARNVTVEGTPTERSDNRLLQTFTID